MGDRRVVEIGPKRREWFGAGGSAPPDAERLLARARDGATGRWEGLGKRAGRSLDQVDAERLLWRAVEAGLVVIRERKTRRGDWEPYQWRLTETGEASLPPRAQGPMSRDTWHWPMIRTIPCCRPFEPGRAGVGISGRHAHRARDR